MDDKPPLKDVAMVTWPILHFGGQNVSLKHLKVESSNSVYR